MDLNFINNGAVDSIAIVAILAFGIIAFVGLTFYHRQKAKNTLASFKNSAVRYLNEARQPGLAIENVFEKIWYVALSLIALDNLGDQNWRLKDIGTNEKEIFDLLEISTLEDIKNLVRQGVKSAEDIVCIIERCRESPPVAS